MHNVFVIQLQTEKTQIKCHILYATYCGILSGYILFAKTKLVYREKKYNFIFKKCNLGLLKLYNGPFQLHCINPEGRTHKCNKGSAYNQQ